MSGSLSPSSAATRIGGARTATGPARTARTDAVTRFQGGPTATAFSQNLEDGIGLRLCVNDTGGGAATLASPRAAAAAAAARRWGRGRGCCAAGALCASGHGAAAASHAPLLRARRHLRLPCTPRPRLLPPALPPRSSPATVLTASLMFVASVVLLVSVQRAAPAAAAAAAAAERRAQLTRLAPHSSLPPSLPLSSPAAHLRAAGAVMSVCASACILNWAVNRVC